jgi:putative transposase
MDVCEAKRLKALEEGNTRLKKPLPDRMLDAAAVRELLEKNGRAPAKGQAVAHLRGAMGLSERRACQIVAVDSMDSGVGAKGRENETALLLLKCLL